MNSGDIHTSSVISSSSNDGGIVIPFNSSRLTLCLVGGIIGRMENNGWKMVWKTVFSTVWEARKTKRMENPGENFLPGPTNFFPLKSGGKLWRESCSYREITQMPSPTYPPHKHNGCLGIK